MIAVSISGFAKIGFRSSLALQCLAIAACAPTEPLVYEPSGWMEDEGAWIAECAGTELRTYQKIIEDVSAQTFRLELELVNRSGGMISVDEKSRLATGGGQYSGKIFRLFSPQGNTVANEEYAEFAALFYLRATVREVLGDQIEIDFSMRQEDESAMPCSISLHRE